MEKERACEGGMTYDCDPSGDFVACHYCDREVRWDMRDHPFWGFASSCDWRRAVAAKAATEQSGSDRRER